MSPFWVWFWHIIAGLIALLIGLPTFVLVKLEKKFALHTPVVLADVEHATYADKTMDGGEVESLVEGFNHSNFLRRYTKPPAWNGPCLHVGLKTRHLSYDLYPYHNEINVLKRKGRKVVAYQVQSSSLQAWFANHA